MNWNKFIRQAHRWLSTAFTLVVLINGIAVARGKYSPRWGLAAVAVLTLMFCTGMYLFVLPYTAKWRSVRRNG